MAGFLRSGQLRSGLRSGQREGGAIAAQAPGRAWGHGCCRRLEPLPTDGTLPGACGSLQAPVLVPEHTLSGVGREGVDGGGVGEPRGPPPAAPQAFREYILCLT